MSLTVTAGNTDAVIQTGAVGIDPTITVPANTSKTLTSTNGSLGFQLVGGDPVTVSDFMAF